ncbi:MAG: hypothetical protein KF912_09920 [Phycisphaeraceae bacterium]|nr:hypothetical protein [Phycisphaeraceae bacterium]
MRPDCGGSFAALVVPRSGGPTYAVTCHHFAAMSNGYLGIPVQAATFSLVDDPGAGTFGELSAHIGRIVPPGAASLDVALVEVRPDMLDVARRAVGPHRPMNVLPATDLPPEEVLIVASRNEAPIRARFVIAHKDFNGIDYFPRGHLQPRHDVVWEFLGLDSGQTVGGDSGCAVINGRGDTLLAMHVAGGKGTSRTGGRSFAIPIRFAIYGPNIGLQDFLDPIA